VRTAEEALSEFVEGITAESLPADVAERMRLHILDAVACGFAGVNAQHSSFVGKAAISVFGTGHSTVIGGASLSPAGAVFVNGFQIAAPTLGDVHRKTLTHVMPEVLPASLATATLHGARGKAFLAGIAAGLEVTVRVAEALDTDAYRARGFHNPGIAGAVGAACAAARVMRLSAHEVRIGLGHAASQAAGTFAALGTDGVKVHQARGGVSGFLAAQLAASHIDASAQALTAPRGGLLAAYADGGIPDRLTNGLGSDWRLMDIALRRWPGASSLQPVIEATLGLRDELGSDVAQRVDVALPPRAYALNGASGWQTPLSALQSATWIVAVALADGEIWLEQTDERRGDERVADFAKSAVYVVQDDSLPSTGARVTIDTRLGRQLSRTVEVPPGDPQRPLSQPDVETKLQRAASSLDLGQRVPSILDAVYSLASAPSVESLTALLEV
jgi:2-methylcitrate dehydratase PrpD